MISYTDINKFLAIKRKVDSLAGTLIPNKRAQENLI